MVTSFIPAGRGGKRGDHTMPEPDVTREDEDAPQKNVAKDAMEPEKASKSPASEAATRADEDDDEKP